MNYAEAEGLQAAIARICEESAQAVRDGKTLLTDKKSVKASLPANAAWWQQVPYIITLIKTGLRTDANILVETGFARDPHQFAVITRFWCNSSLPIFSL